MINVEILRAGKTNGARAGRGAVRRIKVDGHAGYAAPGEDIVCAAASATIYTAAGALNCLCGAPDSCADERDGYFLLTVPDFKDGDISRKADVIMETTYIGYKQIELSYPDFLKVTEIEK